MMFVSGLDRATADRHFRLRAAQVPGGLSGRPVGPSLQDAMRIAHADGRLRIETNAADRGVAVTWTDPDFGEVVGRAIARPGYGGIVLGSMQAPRFEARPIARETADTGEGVAAWWRGRKAARASS